MTFDGGFISVIELKKAIVEKKKLGHGSDFDLRVTDAQSGQGNNSTALFFLYSVFSLPYFKNIFFDCALNFLAARILTLFFVCLLLRI